MFLYLSHLLEFLINLQKKNMERDTKRTREETLEWLTELAKAGAKEPFARVLSKLDLVEAYAICGPTNHFLHNFCERNDIWKAVARIQLGETSLTQQEETLMPVVKALGPDRKLNYLWLLISHQVASSDKEDGGSFSHARITIFSHHGLQFELWNYDNAKYAATVITFFKSKLNFLRYTMATAQTPILIIGLSDDHHNTIMQVVYFLLACPIIKYIKKMDGKQEYEIRDPVSIDNRTDWEAKRNALIIRNKKDKEEATARAKKEAQQQQRQRWLERTKNRPQAMDKRRQVRTMRDADERASKIILGLIAGAFPDEVDPLEAPVHLSHDPEAVALLRNYHDFIIEEGIEDTLDDEPLALLSSDEMASVEHLEAPAWWDRLWSRDRRAHMKTQKAYDKWKESNPSSRQRYFGRPSDGDLYTWYGNDDYIESNFETSSNFIINQWDSILRDKERYIHQVYDPKIKAIQQSNTMGSQVKQQEIFKIKEAMNLELEIVRREIEAKKAEALTKLKRSYLPKMRRDLGDEAELVDDLIDRANRFIDKKKRASQRDRVIAAAKSQFDKGIIKAYDYNATVAMENAKYDLDMKKINLYEFKEIIQRQKEILAREKSRLGDDIDLVGDELIEHYPGMHQMPSNYNPGLIHANQTTSISISYTI